MTRGGWTVFQLRQDGSEDFYRGWADYISGLGNRTGEYWLGLDYLHALTLTESEAFIYLEAFEDGDPVTANVTYSKYRIDGHSSSYTLHSEGYQSTCKRVLWFPPPGNGMPFTTKDVDNDNREGNCAIAFQGAWWYENCHSLNLNGQYLKGEHSSTADGVNFVSCWGYNYSLKKTIMKLRRA